MPGTSAETSPTVEIVNITPAIAGLITDAKAHVILPLKEGGALRDVGQINVQNSCDPKCLSPIACTQADTNFRMIHALPQCSGNL